MPTKTVADAFEVDLGDRVLAFKAHGPAHTDCDLSMLDKQTGLLLPADLLFVKRVPSIDGNLLGWLKELDALKAIGATKAVPWAWSRRGRVRRRGGAPPAISR